MDRSFKQMILVLIIVLIIVIMNLFLYKFSINKSPIEIAGYAFLALFLTIVIPLSFIIYLKNRKKA